MRRTVLMLGLAALAAGVTPLVAGAEQSGHRGTGRTVLAGLAKPADFTLKGQPCSLIPVPKADSALPVGVGSCEGVRPGAPVQTEIGLCTLNFLFTAADGQRYIGTAGHCVLGSGPTEQDAGEKAWAKGTGPEAKDGDGNRIGEFAYAILQDPKDFSLIRLDPGVEASPEMCDFGGPTGVNDDQGADPVVLQYFGNGIAIGSTVPARSGVALGTPDPDHVHAVGLALPGDSGSAVISDDGRAVGVLVTTGLHGGDIGDAGIDFGTMGITRLAPQVARAEEFVGALVLQTAG